jgi:hypothetical protein
MASQENEMRAQLDRLEEMLPNVLKAIDKPGVASNSVNNSNFYVQAGGVMAMVLLCCAAFVLGIALDTSFSLHSDMAKMQQRQDRQDDYLSAIYVMAPQLKPKEQKK